MPVSRIQLMNELIIKMENDKEAKDDFADQCDVVVFHWQGLAADTFADYAAEGKGGWATGEYVASIHRTSVRRQHPAGTVIDGVKVGGRIFWNSKAITYNEHAHLLEYGTDADDAPNYPLPPNAYGHWVDHAGVEHWHWNTPTPAFGIAAQVEADFNSRIGRMEEGFPIGFQGSGTVRKRRGKRGPK